MSPSSGSSCVVQVARNYGSFASSNVLNVCAAPIRSNAMRSNASLAPMRSNAMSSNATSGTSFGCAGAPVGAPVGALGAQLVQRRYMRERVKLSDMPKRVYDLKNPITAKNVRTCSE